MEEWLNGWTRRDDIVWAGASYYCAGCGRLLGVACVAPPEEGFIFLEKMPDFPFPENDCPLCRRWHQYLDITVEDIAKLDISILRKAIAIKKSIKGNNHDNK